jgi:putative transposase
LFALVVTGAKVEDAVAAPALVRQIRPAVCPRWDVLWADSKYHNHALEAWMGRPNAGPVRIEVTRPTDDEPGFKPIKWRWVIERTNGWVKHGQRA